MDVPFRWPDRSFGSEKVACWLLVGVCGAGMRAFLQMLTDAGERVAGTDSDHRSLQRLQMSVSSSLQIFPWNKFPTFDKPAEVTVVHSLAVPPDEAILESARRAGCRVLDLPQAMGILFSPMQQVCIAGTHGKTTTAGMTWWILNQAGLTPAGFIGGEICGTNRSGAFGRGEIAVIESCEYRGAFLQFRPTTAVFTGIEADHFDCFPCDADSDRTFQTFAGLLPPEGRLLIDEECARSRQIAGRQQCRINSYQIFDTCPAAGSTSHIGDSRWAAYRTAFRAHSFEQHAVIQRNGESVAEITLRVPGIHNVKNAMGAFLAAFYSGVSVSRIQHGLQSFPGMRRRFEHRGYWRGADMIDDYAHHPTAIRAAVNTAREIYPGRRILAIFEPHQLSRTLRLFPEFVRALSGFDECWTLPVLPARESSGAGICRETSAKLAAAVVKRGTPAIALPGLDQVLGRLDHSSRPGDVIITLGAGRTDQIHDEIHRRLQRDSAA